MHVPLTVRDFLDRASQVYGDRIGIIDEPDQPAESWGAITYRELERRASAFAAGLDALDILPGERVAIVAHNSARWIAALYGTCMSGRVLVPINFRLHAREVEYIVRHSGARVLLVDPEVDVSLGGVTAEHRFVLGEPSSDATLFRYDRGPRDVELDENSVATINYTSGTTARPKGVQLTHRNLWLNATTFGWHSGISDRDAFLHIVPLFHCNGWGMPFALAAMGATQAALRKVSGPEILNRIEKHGITMLAGAPAVVNAVLDAAKGREAVPGRGVTRILVAGAPPPTRTIERVEAELGWEFIQLYGLTETSPLITINRRRAEYDALTPAERAIKLGRAGAPVIGSRVKVDAHGEVLSRANVVMAGYWNDPAATDAAIVDGWFHTGDGGVMDAEGYLSISDRKKDVIITGGENVSSIEVEDCLQSHPAVAEAAVIGVPDEKWGETVKGLVVLRPGLTADEIELLAHCRAHLAHYKCPTSIEVRTDFARTATGKLQKFILRAPYWEGRTRQVS